jgi:hypothetical protein
MYLNVIISVLEAEGEYVLACTLQNEVCFLISLDCYGVSILNMLKMRMGILSQLISASMDLYLELYLILFLLNAVHFISG